MYRYRQGLYILVIVGLFLVAIPRISYTQEGNLEKAKVLNQKVIELYQQGRYAEAIPVAEKVLAIVEKALGPEHPHVALSLNNLAALYDSLGDYARAEPLFQRALSIAATAGCPEILWTVQGWLSSVYAKQGNTGAAVFFGKQAVNTIQGLRAGLVSLEEELQKSFLRPKEYVYKDLADLLIDQGRLPEAQQVLAMLKEEEYFDFVRRANNWGHHTSF
jgi:tetratricopeptide (TPR) repeat protein